MLECRGNMIELGALQSAKRVGPPNDGKRFVGRDRGERGHPDNVLREDVVRLFQHLDRIEDRLPDELSGGDRFHEIIDIGRHQHAMAAPVKGMSRAPNPLNGA